MERPKRAFTLDIQITGDTWNDVKGYLDWIADHVAEHGPKCKSVSGGVSGGHIVTITHRPEQTPEKFQADLRAYLEAKR